MSLNRIPILIDITTGNLIRDFDSAVQTNLPSFKQSDLVLLDFMLVEPIRSSSKIWRYLDLADYTVRCALGNVGSTFTGGTMKFSYDGTSAAASISINASPSVVETHINTITTITAAGGVTVVGSSSSPYKITFVTAGAREEIGVDVSNSFPDAVSQLTVVEEGDVSTKSVQFVSLSVAPAVISGYFSDLPVATGTIEVISAGSISTNAVFNIDLSTVLPYDGAFRLVVDAETSTLIPITSDAADVQVILEAMTEFGADNVSVTGAFPIYTVELIGALANTALGVVTVDPAGLKVPLGKRGTLDLKQVGVDALLADEPNVRAKLEFEIVDGLGNPFTPCQIEVTVINDLLSNSPAPSASPTINDGFVAYIAQTPTNDQILAALTNLKLVPFNNGNISGSFTPSRLSGETHLGNCTANLNINAPTGGTSGNKLCLVFKSDGGAFDLTFTGIVMPAAQLALLPITLETDLFYVVELQMAGTVWILTNIYQTFAP